jgi:hypothetical protein
MGRAQLLGAIHKIGEKGELSLDVVFGPAAIDQDHGAGSCVSVTGMAG